MNRILLTASTSAMQCRPHHGLGRAWALLDCEGTYGFSSGKFIGAGIDGIVAERLNLDRFIGSGRCRAILTPT